MYDNKKKKTFFFTFFFVFFCFLLLTATSGFVSAKLEAPYPKIAGQSLTGDSQLPEFVLYLFTAGMAIGFAAVFISLVMAGVMYFLSPVSAQLKADAKDRIGGAFSGLLILLLTY